MRLEAAGLCDRLKTRSALSAHEMCIRERERGGERERVLL